MKSIRIIKSLLTFAALGLLVTGCRLIQQAANVPGQAVNAMSPGKPAAPAANPWRCSSG